MVAALVAVAPLAPAFASQRAEAPATRAAATRAAVSHQRAKVERLEHAVADQEAGSHAATQRLREKDARIAELQRQLQAVQAGGGASRTGQ